jgi:hypothetical protein
LDLSHNRIQFIVNLPPNLELLNLTGNELTHLSYINIPKTLYDLNLDDNRIMSFDGSSLPQLLYLSIFKNQLVNFEFPPNLQYINMKNNFVEMLCNFPGSLVFLDCSHNNLRHLSGLNHELKELLFTHNPLEYFPYIDYGFNITSIQGSYTGIRKIFSLPTKLRTLIMNDCKLSEVCEFPSTLTELDLSSNYLRSIPRLYYGLIDVRLNDNFLVHLPNIPLSVSTLDISGNKKTLKHIPNELKERHIPDFKYDNSDDENDFTLLLNGEDSSHSNKNHTFDEYAEFNGQYRNDEYEFDRSQRNDDLNNDGHLNKAIYESLRSHTKMRDTNPNYVSYGNKKKVEI